MRKTLIVCCALEIILAGLIGIGCNKSNASLDSDTSSAMENEEAEFISADALNMADAAAKGQISFKRGPAFALLGGPCATITLVSGADTSRKTLTIDFGATNCQCADLRNRRGKISVTWTGGYFVPNVTKTIAFSNYYVNNNRVNGSKTITNNAKNAAGNWSWTINVQNMKVTHTDSSWFTWSSSRVRELIADSVNWMKNVYSQTGSASGSDNAHVGFSATITKPIIKANNCQWIQSGTFTLTPTGKVVRTLDFGNGCNNMGTVTIGSNTFHFIKH